MGLINKQLRVVFSETWLTGPVNGSRTRPSFRSEGLGGSVLEDVVKEIGKNRKVVVDMVLVTL